MIIIVTATTIAALITVIVVGLRALARHAERFQRDETAELARLTAPLPHDETAQDREDRHAARRREVELATADADTHEALERIERVLGKCLDAKLRHFLSRLDLPPAEITLHLALGRAVHA